MFNPTFSQTLTTMNAQRLIKWIGLPLLLVALVAGGFLLGRMTDGEPAAVAQHETPAGEGERNVLYWRAPMDPTEIYDQPGKSKMDMDLIPVYADEMEDQ